MGRPYLPTLPRRKNALLVLLSLLIAGCGMTLRRPADSAARVSVERRDTLFIGMPAVPDSAQASLADLGWGGGRFQEELRKEIAFQFGRKRVALIDDSASAKAWLSVDIAAIELGKEPAYQGAAHLRTGKGEREIEFHNGRSRWRGAERSDPTVDYIRQIAETLVTEACRNPASAPKHETPPHMLMFN